MDLNNVRGLLVNISSANITVGEVNEIGRSFQELTIPNANFKTGLVEDESMGDALRITVIATGIEADTEVESDPVADVDLEMDAKPLPLKTIKGGGVSSPEAPQSPALSEPESEDDKYNNLLDIPAFLRKQVD